MTGNARHRGPTIGVVAMAGLLTVSCDTAPPAADLPDCHVHRMTFQPTSFGEGLPSRMSVVNNQKWCSIRFFTPYGDGNYPFREGVLLQPPVHGEVRVRSSAKLGAMFLYRPAAGFTGVDHFKVEYGPAGGVRWVKVDVRPGNGPPPAAAIP